MVRLAYQKIHGKGIDPLTIPCAVDVGCTEKYLTYGVDIAKTLSRARGGSGGFWISTRGRKMTTDEMIRVSGICPGELAGWEKHCTPALLGRMLGNFAPVDCRCSEEHSLGRRALLKSTRRNPRYEIFVAEAAPASRQLRGGHHSSCGVG